MKLLFDNIKDHDNVVEMMCDIKRMWGTKGSVKQEFEGIYIFDTEDRFDKLWEDVLEVFRKEYEETNNESSRSRV